jgi:type I restriction enzyme S subunit
MATLPDSWAWSTIGLLSQVNVGSTPRRDRSDYWNGGDIPWVSSSEVAFNRINQTHEYITKNGLGNQRLRPPGTILLAMIGEGKTRGQCAVLEIYATTNQNVASIIPFNQQILSEYVYYWLMSRYENTRKYGEGGVQPALNSDRVRQIPIPIASTDEQRVIVQKIDALFFIDKEIDKVVVAAIQKATVLRQSILSRAFVGGLVSQDPSDEPAEKLLERIKAERLNNKSKNNNQVELFRYVK